MFEAFLIVTTVHMLGLISPGPDFVMIVRNSLVYSRRTGIMTALGIAMGVGVHVTYSLLGIGLLVSKSILLFNALKTFGALYLLYLAYHMLRSQPKTKEELAVFVKPDIAPSKAFKIGFLTNVFNPKATLFFLAVFSQVIDPATGLLLKLAFGTEMIILTFLWFAFVANVLTIARITTSYQRITHHIDRLMGGVLAILGLKILFSSKE
ncbi:LysE family translocator [Candidatus Uhrbacteria bacterium]|nr:LysE family translocator [Candidatus Uhrbacteria bacterium]